MLEHSLLFLVVCFRFYELVVIKICCLKWMILRCRDRNRGIGVILIHVLDREVVNGVYVFEEHVEFR